MDDNKTRGEEKKIYKIPKEENSTKHPSACRDLLRCASQKSLFSQCSKALRRADVR